jgi:hypothetical protein
MSRTMSPAEYRITLARLIAPAPIAQPKPSICYPDRHRRTDKQVAMSTVRYMVATLVCVAVAIAITLAVR